jgi:hypothetical protein
MVQWKWAFMDFTTTRKNKVGLPIFQNLSIFGIKKITNGNLPGLSVYINAKYLSIPCYQKAAIVYLKWHTLVPPAILLTCLPVKQ